MARCRSRFYGLLCLAWVVVSGMPIGSFLKSMVVDGADDEYTLVETQKIVQRQEFKLSSSYDDFNRIGEAQFKILQHKGLDSECWRDAAMSINADCATMTTARKQRLAAQLSNCHLKSSGRPGIKCSHTDSDEQCATATKHDKVAFDDYSKFFHHVNAICHHLSQSVWQEQTEDLVRGLTASSLATFDRTEKSLEKQEQVLEGQALAAAQSQGIADGLSETSARLSGFSDRLSEDLVSAMGQIQKQESVLASLMATQALAATQASSFSTELDSAKSELVLYMEAIEEDRRESKKQNVDLMETIGFIHSCLDNASSAWAKFQAFTYLILAVNLCWVMTTAPPLRSARMALFGLVAFGLLLEKSLCGDGSTNAERSFPAGWVVTGLRLASPGTFSADTWDMVVTQEKIRWLTFQAGAVILGHALVTYFLPFLQLGRLVGFLMGAWKSRRRNNTSDDSGASNSSPDNSTGCSGGDDQISVGRVHPLRLLFDGVSGGRGGAGSDGAGESAGSGGGILVRRRSSNSSNSEPVGGGGGSGGGGSESSGVTVNQPGGRAQAARGGGSEDEEGDEIRGDGLDALDRKELQSLAKSTNGAVRANLSSPNIIRGLRAHGITADTQGQ